MEHAATRLFCRTPGESENVIDAWATMQMWNEARFVLSERNQPEMHPMERLRALIEISE